MASRLPIPGQDNGTWGDILNDYLSQSLAADGTIKPSAIASKAPLASPTFTGTVTVPTPTNATDATTKAYVDATVSSGAPDASPTTKGIVKLAGDLAGTAALPTVPALATKANASALTAHTTDTTNPHVVTKAQVGLGNADNTSDANKPVSTAQATAIATKEPTITAGTTGQYYRGDKSWQTLDKTAVGLSSVDNTSDANKPVSTATQTALNLKLTASSNLSDLASAGTARTNLGLGTAATISSTAGGDLSGTLPSPTVAKVNGVAVTGTPTSGQVITATSGTAAAWSTPASGMADPTTTKGDLIVHGTTTTRQAVGGNGQVLTADSAQTTGVKWAAVSGTVPTGGTTGQVLAKNTSTDYDASWANSAPLAQSGQTPSQNPVAPGAAASVGTLTQAARADHVHPLGTLGRSMMFMGLPPSYSANSDIVFDGTFSGTLPNNSYGLWGSGNGMGWATRSGSTYTASSVPPLIFRNFTLNAGITLLPKTSTQGLVIMASQSITINGTINVAGNAAAGATGGNGQSSSSSNSPYYGGGIGSTGTTGAGSAGNSANNTNYLGVGGSGGAGGASGATAGGAGGVGNTINPNAFFLAGGNFLLLTSAQSTSSWGLHSPYAGAGGGSGAGDGTNAGGGGGAGGGIVILLAPTITIGSTAVINANGGNGASGVGGNAGGGGGGGGGLIDMNALSLSIVSGATMTANGGSGGTGAGTGAAGVSGGQSAFVDPPTNQGGYGYGGGFLLSQWQ